MAQTAEKAGSGEEKSECLVLAQKAELFTEPEGVSREPLLSGSSLLDSQIYGCPKEGVGGRSGMGAPAVVCLPSPWSFNHFFLPVTSVVSFYS